MAHSSLNGMFASLAGYSNCILYIVEGVTF
jgi:hypothetical protein